MDLLRGRLHEDRADRAEQDPPFLAVVSAVTWVLVMIEALTIPRRRARPREST